mmetsp:Transcript_22353/g.33024  ORF Transcript_22353/g.33024 Transcript_22353/m.33024 type:complete len:97 (+) Transcript_22353:182-472(+)|eukprot:CAMPEP_0194206856 /NCGR_PEP_ID=MMETSP0156-20130528/5777_1 /TAXON_ID=33649 /ORGANISM="Thalassionema nitzschioides, Strain L26-B" /LENGTH=96 /DNA_ID=CAMNT_0038933485 /DNA_START=136 /DNA_END=426 /DNA_ORIENTATION=-
MIIDAKAIIVTLLIVAVALYGGLQFVRSFALSIAQENHDANVAIDQAEEEKRQKQERNADVAAASAFAKVEPLLTVPTNKPSAPKSGEVALGSEVI